MPDPTVISTLRNSRTDVGPDVAESTTERRQASVMSRGRSLPVSMVALATLGSGLLNLYSLIGPALPERTRYLGEIFPLEFLHLSRFLTLLIGFALTISAINIYKRKRRAFQSVFLLSGLSIGFHLTKGLDYEEATFSGVLFVLLFLTRHSFTVRSSTPDWRWALNRLLVAIGAATGYGIAGFWFLDPREFGMAFTLGDAIHRTFLFLTLRGDPTLVPHTRHALWFQDSLEVMTVAVIAYAAFALFRPAFYQFRTVPQEREQASRIVAQHGRSSQDFFKYWPDKSLFFSRQEGSFLSYRVSHGFALVLGDPVGPVEAIHIPIREFAEMCRENGWKHAFYQTLPDYLPVYTALGYRKLKIGDDAIVNLTQFALEGKEGKKLRSKVNQFEKQGITTEYFQPPLSDAVLTQAREVSDEWLQIPGRRERGFTLGMFEPEYVRSTPLFAVKDQDGRFFAFANLIPSFCKGEVTIDLMRHRLQTPNGTMDYLFIKLFLLSREQGFTRFNLGMAPMAGFQEHEQATREERAVHYFMQQLNFLFSFSGLRQYKAKFASFWEPRYAVYQSALDLPRLALALRAVSELPDEE